ncbi:DUF6483 family protein [Butyrivibrio sp. INlla16]|uniref:DUF6483 family protein n=1 Tax=Butyrivibrio sp. INlla16 TaxID=1520807 RepID=UPI0034DD57CF
MLRQELKYFLLFFIVTYVATAVLFYQYLSEKSESFLTEHDFSKGEVLDGMNRLVQEAGYGALLNIVEELSGNINAVRACCL